MIESKKQMFVIIGVFTLILLVTSVTYAFFNYTKTGNANNLRVGQVLFSSSEAGNINLSNVFPIDRTDAPSDNVNSAEVVVTVTGSTTYDNGLEYLITIEDVNIETSSHKKLPIGIIVTPEKDNTELGTESNDYFTVRGSTTSYYKVLANDVIKDGDYILVGYIKPGQAEINGKVGIRAFIDKDNIVISDTYDGLETDNMGTTSSFVRGRVVLTTDEWNNLTGNNAISFKVKVQANDGVWVSEPASRNDMINFNPLSNPVFSPSQKESITEINFIRMSEEMINTHQDLIDLTAEGGSGVVKAWIENNKLYIASPGETYFPVISSSLFSGFSAVTKINFNNVNTSYVEQMAVMFQNCRSLESIDLHSFDTSNVVDMQSMFSSCSNLTDIDLSYLNTESIRLMSGMFQGCTMLLNVNLSGLGGDNLISSYLFSPNLNIERIDMSNFNFGTQTSLSGMFSDISSLEEIILKDANTSNVTDMTGVINRLTNLTTLDIRGIDTSNVVSFQAAFAYNPNLTTIRGLEELDTTSAENMNSMFFADSSLTNLDLSNFDTSNVTSMAGMFSGCSSLTRLDLSSFDTSLVTVMRNMFSMRTYSNNSYIPLENSLTTINVGINWSTNSVTDSTDMFYNCTHLVGGNGTTYNSNIVDKTYAKVDGGSLDPGYLTFSN